MTKSTNEPDSELAKRIRTLIQEYRDDLNDRNFPSIKVALKCIADELESALEDIE